GDFRRGRGPDASEACSTERLKLRLPHEGHWLNIITKHWCRWHPIEHQPRCLCNHQRLATSFTSSKNSVRNKILVFFARDGAECSVQSEAPSSQNPNVDKGMSSFFTVESGTCHGVFLRG